MPYNIAKCKRWIKRAAKDALYYDSKAELVSDGKAIIRVTPSMKPTLLEVFGHLNGGFIKDGSPSEKCPDLTKFMRLEGRQLIDSELRYPAKGFECRILYFEDTREKIFIDQEYASLINDFHTYHITADTSDGTQIQIISEDVFAVIVPLNFERDILRHVQFVNRQQEVAKDE